MGVRTGEENGEVSPEHFLWYVRGPDFLFTTNPISLMTSFLLLPSAPIRSAVFFAAAFFFAVLSARGQSGTLVGLELRLHDVRHSGAFILNDEPALGSFPDAGGFGQSLGLTLRHHLSPSFGLSGTIAWNRLPGSSDLPLRNPSGSMFEVRPLAPDPTGDSTVPFDRAFTAVNTVVYSALSLEGLAEWRLTGSEGEWSLGIAAGPTLSLTLDASTRQTVRLDEPEYMRFVGASSVEDNGRTLVLHDDNLVDAESFRIGVRGGLFAEFRLPASDIVISPALFYESGLTPLRKNPDLTTTMITGQVGVMIQL